MRTIYFVAITICFLINFASLSAQQGNVAITDFHPDFEHKSVVVEYTIFPIGQYRQFNVNLVGTLNGKKLDIRSFAVNSNRNVKAGKKNLIWYPQKDGYTTIKGILQLSIVCSNPLDWDMDGIPNNSDPRPYSEDSYRTLIRLPLLMKWKIGSGFTIGSGLIVLGGTEMWKASRGKAYQLFKNYTNPIDPVFPENGFKDRQAAYEQGNQKYKDGQYVLYSGIGILLTSVVVWLDQKEKSKKKAEELLKNFEIRPYTSSSIDMPLGVQLIHKF
ncbi:MAG: hypothetical protein R2828_29995 [Saprospiraceae bacterium]